jgi:hypothetical protein
MTSLSIPSSKECHVKRIRILIPIAMIASLVGIMAGPASASTSAALTVVYNSTVKPLPANLPSVGAEAYSFNEFGDEITFGSTERNVKKVIVTLSSWACQSGTWHTGDCLTTQGATFAVPITLNIYHATNTDPSSDPVLAGGLISTVTQTFNVPYRPSASAVCTGADAGKWFKNGQGCFNGLANNVRFKFAFRNVLPNTVVYGITYNTTHYGYSPLGEGQTCFGTPAGCAYDSLNIALAPTVTIGSKPYADTVFQDAAYAADYCDGTPLVGTFNLDSPTSACWNSGISSYIPAVQFSAR